MTSPTDALQRSRTFAVLAPITFSDNKYHHTSKHSYSTLQRIASLPEISISSRYQSPYVGGPPHRPSPFRRPLRDWDLWDDYWADRRYFTSPLRWPDHSRVTRRHYYLDPPYGLLWNYPALPWYPQLDNRQVALMEQVDPLYNRRYRDPNYDRPSWQPSQRWPHEVGYRVDPRRMLQMYRQKLIDYDTLQKHWLTPFSVQRKIDEYDRQPKEEPVYTTFSSKPPRPPRSARASSVGRHVYNSTYSR